MTQVRILRIFVSICLVLMIAAVGFIGLCTIDSSYAEAGSKPIKLTSSDIGPSKRVFSMSYEWFLDELERRSNGKVVIKRYFSGALARAKETLPGLGRNLFDFGAIWLGRYPAELPLLQLPTMPAVTSKPGVLMSAANDLAKNKFYEKEQQKNNTVFIYFISQPPYELISVKKVKTLDDLKGMKVRTSGTAHAQLFNAIGSVPVQLPGTEIYGALQTGVVDACNFDFIGTVDWSFHEVIKYGLEIGVGCTGGYFAMSRDSWNKLPQDIKNLIRQIASDVPAWHQNYISGTIQKRVDSMESRGIRFGSLSKTDKARLRSLAKEKIWSQWVKKQKAGIPAQDLLDYFLERVDYYENKF